MRDRVIRLMAVMGTFCAWCAGEAAAATVVASTKSVVTSVVTYPATGDVVVVLQSSGIAACPGGFWIRPTDAGAKGTFSQAMAAYYAGNPVYVYADTSTTWPGNSTSATCLVVIVQY